MWSSARSPRAASISTARSLALCLLLAFVLVGSGPAAALAGAQRGPVPVPERSVGAIAVRPDGGIVIAGRTGECLAASEAARTCAGRHFYLAEFDRHGHLVPGFGGEWPARRLGGVRAMAIGPEGDVFLAGKSNGGARLARFDGEGHLDRDFGAGGVVDFGMVGDRVLPKIEALAIESDGAAVAAGVARTVSGAQEVLLLRFQPDGSLDLGFGTAGAVLTPFAPGPRLGPSEAQAVALMGDGRIVVAGSTELTTKLGSALFAARYLPDGELDASFGTRGQSAVAASMAHSIYDEGLAVLPDGTVVLAGGDATRPFVIDGFCQRPVVARLLPDGSPDPAFGGQDGEEPGVLDAGPRVGSPCGAMAADVLDDGDVSFVLSGEGGSSVYPGRLAPDGSRVPGFASPSSTALFPPRGGFFVHFKLAAGGRVAAGEVVRPIAVGTDGNFPSHSVIIIARHADGKLRRGFGDGGVVIFPPG